MSVRRRRMAIVALLALQAGWLGTIMLRGWYSGPDLPNLGAATGRSLDSDYLTQSLGGHFGVPARLLFWVLNRIDPLGWGLTVGIRLVLQALATFLLLKLLEDLVGRRTWLLGVVGLYAFSPLLVPATAVLSNGIGLSIAQTSILGALLLHVRYVRTGGLWRAVVSAVLVLLALSFADEVVIVLLLLPTLSLGFVLEGSLRTRLREGARQWPGWAALLVSGGVFAVLYLTGSYTGRPAGFTANDAWFIVHNEWTHVLGPALLGGPWQWFSLPDQWVAYANPPGALRLAGQVVLVLVLASLRRTGPKALLAWAIPLVTTVVGVLLVGYGRSDFLGTLVAPILRYSYYSAMTLAIGVTLAFAGGRPVRKPLRWGTAGGMVLVTAASIGSGLGFANTFWDNPSKPYVDHLTTAVRHAGPTLQLWDSSVPDGVVPGLEPNHFVSDVLGLAGVKAVYDGPSGTPLVIDKGGRPVLANVVQIGDITSPTQAPCGTFVHGAGRTVVDLSVPPTEGDWFLQLQAYEPHPNTLTLEVRDQAGHLLAVRGGSATVRPTDGLVSVIRRVDPGRPATLTLIATDTTTNFCLVHAYVDAPFPVQVR